MKQRSKTVDNAIRDTWARLAREAAKVALAHVQGDRMGCAEEVMTFTADWLDKAGDIVALLDAVTPQQALRRALDCWRNGEPIPVDVHTALAEAGYVVEVLEQKHRG